MTQRTLFSILAAGVFGLLPSCGDDDGDDDGGTGTGGRASAGGTSAAGDAGAAGFRTGGAGGGTGALGGSSGQPSVGGAAGESPGTGGAAGEPSSGGAGASTLGGAAGGGAAGAGEAGSGILGGGGSGGESDASAGGGGEQGGSAGDASGLDDPEILHAVSTANQGEIEQATIALDRAVDDSVRAFAEMMLEEHGASLAAGSELSQSIGLANNALSVELMSASNAVVVQLEAASAAAFDTLYVRAQVTMHEDVLSLLEDELIPHAESAALETYLETTRSAVATHLQAAQALAEDLE